MISIKKYYKSIFWLSVLISAVLLFMPGGTKPGLPYVDKLAHFLLFGWLCLFGLESYRQYFLVISSLVTYAIIAEFIQYFFIPNRGLEFMDTIVGIVGIFCIYFIIKYLYKRINKEV
jgi:VanZ family protein